MTVYVLGAGASKHVGYPLASEMGSGMLSWMSKHERYQGEAEAIREMFGDSPNIEDVITGLDEVIKSGDGSDKIEERAQRTVAANLRGALGVVLPQWFREIHTNPAPAYEQFAEDIVQPGDVIITFNYDDSLERELKRACKWEVSQGYGFQIGRLQQQSPVLVLKLHGSMNWLVSIFGGVTSGPFAIGDNRSLGDCPCVATDFLKYLGYPDMPGNFPGGGGFPSLILPGRTKEFYYQTSFGPEHQEFFSWLWTQAASALERADRLVVCGYSMLSVDERACELLLKAPRKDTRVVVISGKAGTRIVQTFRSAGFKNADCYRNGHFETWVRESAKTRTIVQGIP